jgi:glucose-1-phosphate thymidylyltransferase
MFYDHDLTESLQNAYKQEMGGTVFGCHVVNSRSYGVVDSNEEGTAISIEEKTVVLKYNYAVPGLYFFDDRVVELAKNIKPSPHGELEIADVIDQYL